jgi:hypothetical protein
MSLLGIFFFFFFFLYDFAGIVCGYTWFLLILDEFSVIFLDEFAYMLLCLI